MSAMCGLKVIELGRHIAGAYCAKLMAGFGAEVVQWLHPQREPDWRSEAEAQWYNTGKRRISPSDDAVFETLIAGADIVIDAWGYGALEARGYDTARLHALNPQLIVCRITPFGQTGPYRAFEAEDITLHALSGLMNTTGDGAREPLNPRPKIAQLSAGLNAYIACAMALLRRKRDGGGEVIDVSMFEAALENIENQLAEHLNLGSVARRNGDTPPMVPWRSYACADGEAAIIGGPIRNWHKATPLFDEPALLSEKFAHMSGRIAHRREFEALIQPWLATQTRHDVMRAGQEAGLAWSYLATAQEALADPQHAARGYFVDTQGWRLPGAPFRGPALHWQQVPASAHTETPPRWPRPAARTQQSSTRAPLDGIRVLDFTHDWAGPHAARVLADYGAEVIKIEYPQRLDGMRGAYKDKLDAHPRFWQLHRNKRSLTLDLKNPDHRKVCDELVRGTDLVLENSRAGVMQRKGYGYEQLRALRADISLVSMSAFGATGPYAQYAGYGGTIEAISGLQSLTGYADRQDSWYRVREMDVINGIFGASAAMTALWQRTQTGQGQWIDLSETETCGWMMGEFFAEAARSGVNPARIGNRDAQFAPQGCYAGKGEDRWLSLSIRSDAEWQAFAARMGGKALDARYASVAARRQHHDELDALIETWIRAHDPRSLALELQSLGLAVGWVMNPADLATDAHLAARDWFFSASDGTRLPGLPFRLARGGGELRARGPALGADNAALFSACGLGDALPDLAPEQLGTAYDLS